MTDLHHAPAVTVVMPVFDSSQHLAEAIESVLSQTFTDFELLLVDDGSSDDSVTIASRCRRADRRVRVIRKPHEGLSRTRNRGVGLARGEFIAAMDSDDIAFPDRLSRQHAYLVRHPECVVVGGQVVQVDPDGLPIAPLAVCLHHEDILTELLQGRGSAIVQPSAMFRRSAVLAVGAYDERLGTAEDLDLYLRLAERGVLANLPDTVLFYRRHPGSLTAGYDSLRGRSVKQDVIRRAYCRRGWDERQIAIREFYEPRSPTDRSLTWIIASARAGNFKTVQKHLWRLVQESWRHPSRSIVHLWDAWRRIGLHVLGRVRPWMRSRRLEDTW